MVVVSVALCDLVDHFLRTAKKEKREASGGTVEKGTKKEWGGLDVNRIIAVRCNYSYIWRSTLDPSFVFFFFKSTSITTTEIIPVYFQVVSPPQIRIGVLKGEAPRTIKFFNRFMYFKNDPTLFSPKTGVEF